MILKNLVGYFFAQNDKWKESTKPVNYVLGGNGIFEYRNSPIGSFVTEVKDIPNLEDIETGVCLDIPKIPFDLFNHMVAWHRKIYKKDRTESTIMIFYNEEDGFKLWVPKQDNSSANSKYLRDDDPEYRKMCKENVLIMVAHSHPWKSTSAPSPSGTDNKDEKESILYMIMNNVEDIPYTYVSTCPGGNRIRLEFFDIFENPIEKIKVPKMISDLLNKYIPEDAIFSKYCKPESIEIPEEWMDKHSTSRTSYKSKSLAGKNAYSGYGYGYGTQREYTNYNHHAGYKNSYHKPSNKNSSVSSELSKEEEKILEDTIKEYNKNYALATGKEIIDTDEWWDDIESTYGLSELSSYSDEIYEEVSTDLGSIIDATLELDELNLAQLFTVLIEEGHSEIIEACLGENKKAVTRI